MTTSTINTIAQYHNAGYPIVAVETVEERRLIADVIEHFGDDANEYQLMGIAAAGGLVDLKQGIAIDPRCQFPAAFDQATQRDNVILVVRDWQHIVANGPAYRPLLDRIDALKGCGALVLLLAPSWNLPAEMAHDCPIIDQALPSRDDLQKALNVVCSATGLNVSKPDALLDAATGLTLEEAESAFALSAVECGQLDPSIVEREKIQLVRKSGHLEYWPAVDGDQVGGLDGLKSYVTDEVLPVQDDPQLRVRGVLLVGVPGTGKSLSARAAGSLLGWPVLRLDVAALKGGLVGQSEQNMRAALKLAEAVAPCVLWLDEVEKGLGGFASSAQTDGGTTLGMVGHLLTWLQEHQSPILTVATCNDFSKLPPELTRAGRFDERFFTDCPTPAERDAILRVHLERFGCTFADDLIGNVSRLTDDWTGAELEQLVKSAARRTGRQPTLDVCRELTQQIKPIATVQRDSIRKLRDWAKDSLRSANSPLGGDGPTRRIRQSSPGLN